MYIAQYFTTSTVPQDAERRDLTVNALFYNLKTRTVEDFTGRGLSDLRDGVLRTPLPPLETFREGESVVVWALPSSILLCVCRCTHTHVSLVFLGSLLRSNAYQEAITKT